MHTDDSIEPLVFLKECSCGATHTLGEWVKLPLVGHCEDGGGGTLELRNCRCGSTIAVVCDAFPAADTMPAPPPDFARPARCMATQHEGCQS